MSLTARQVAVPLAGSGLHLKMTGFWVVIVIVILAAVLLVWRARANKRRLRQVSDDWQRHAHPDPGKER